MYFIIRNLSYRIFQNLAYTWLVCDRVTLARTKLRVQRCRKRDNPIACRVFCALLRKYADMSARKNVTSHEIFSCRSLREIIGCCVFSREPVDFKITRAREELAVEYIKRELQFVLLNKSPLTRCYFTILLSICKFYYKKK